MKSRLKNLVRPYIERLDYQRIRPYGDSFWYEGRNLWEPTVQIALRDLCRPGSIVFDVGANFGGLTSVMSRLVGPRGVVCSFEASPRIVGHLQANVVKQGHSNVTVYHNAVYSRSHEWLRIYPGDHLNDSIYDYGHGKPGESEMVRTLALDDLVEATNLVPSLIKMDIEGAEFDALNGAHLIVREHKPHLILEQQTSDARCLALLRTEGYVAIDLGSYRRIDSASDYPDGASLRNVLFVHESRVSELPLALPITITDVMRVAADDFTRTERSVYSRKAFSLSAGRYLFNVDFSASKKDNELMCGIKIANRIVFRYHGYSRLLAENYRDWVADIPNDSDVRVFFDFINGTWDDTFELRGVAISKLKGFVPNFSGDLVLP